MTAAAGLQRLSTVTRLGRCCLPVVRCLTAATVTTRTSTMVTHGTADTQRQCRCAGPALGLLPPLGVVLPPLVGARSLHTLPRALGRYGPSKQVQQQHRQRAERETAYRDIDEMDFGPQQDARQSDARQDRPAFHARKTPPPSAREEHYHRYGDEQDDAGGDSGSRRRGLGGWILTMMKWLLFASIVSFFTILAVQDDTSDVLTVEVMEDANVAEFMLKKEALERAVQKFTQAPLVESYIGKPRHMTLFPMYSLPGTFVPEHERSLEPNYDLVAPCRKPHANLNHWYPSVLLYCNHTTFLLHFHFERRSEEPGYFLQGIRVFKLNAELKYEEGGPPPLGLETMSVLHVPAAALGDETPEDAGDEGDDALMHPMVAVASAVLALLCVRLAVAVPIEAALCPANSKEAVSRAGTFCICVDDFDCEGAACKTGHLGGSFIQGFSTTCLDCKCTTKQKTGASSAQGNSVATAAHSTEPHATKAVAPTHARASPRAASVAALEDGGGGGGGGGGGQRDVIPNIIFIKAFKVASTTIASVFQRLQEEKHLKVANRYNSVQLGMDATFNLIYGHNFFDHGTSPGGSVVGCHVHQNQDGSWTYCGGYQPWMDEYVPNAVHLVMVAEPMERVASMYYYESSYTKLKDRLPGDTQYLRMNDSPRFEVILTGFIPLSTVYPRFGNPGGLRETTKYLGCYSDLKGDGGRFFLKLMSRKLTLNDCWRRCQRDSLPYAALYFGDNCYCGKHPPREDARVEEDGHCNKPCAGEPSRICGGGAFYSVYQELPQGNASGQPILEIPDDMVL
ncbi:hypothetical protein PTSG_01580 [Salpingoeca rosetta]|uniref:WSC domain-containing protein n=1 Tax=Salpingoeca rosetta (strain ATCC 50818 / BSB-021) TaxID=946362 RepID=F2TYC9_SALR5|nr:uncharacterized protein PTSG_01580 [Salpingoeca rosetta]EGD78603.1 hypothetical protein PTSG_01580 [Salpingoeca rosetta]|eukprot:XP_004997561.1 hypothetical protein PTSG_01580 [Salpingoeca rosetta]